MNRQSFFQPRSERHFVHEGVPSTVPAESIPTRVESDTDADGQSNRDPDAVEDVEISFEGNSSVPVPPGRVIGHEQFR